MNIKELEELYRVLLDINERALDDYEFYDLLPNIFDNNIEDLIARLHNILEENGYFRK